MGLTKQNYKIKDTPFTLENAYALIKSMTIEGDYGVAHFVVHDTREHCLSLKPIEEYNIPFKFDRNENPYVTAYKKATEGTSEVYVDPITLQEKTVDSGMPFYKWSDDLQE